MPARHRPKTVRITDTMLRREPAGDKIIRDATVRGLFAVVGKRTKTWWAQYDTRVLGKRRTHKVRLGHFPDMGTGEARQAAQLVLGQRERKPAAAGRGITLRDGHALYIRYMRRKERSERTIEQVDDCCNRLLADFLDLPLIDLAAEPGMVAEYHQALTKAHGPYAANRAMQALRAIYRRTRKAHPYLPPEHPAVAVEFNPEERRNTGMGLQDLPDWFAQLNALQNPVRRELHLFMLLSGMRPDAARQARWEDLHVAERRLRVPKPKGGARRAFDLPLSRGLLVCLNRAKKAGAILHPEQCAEWIFPADSEAGHVVEYKENRETLAKWGDDLRQSYATIAKQLRVDQFMLKLLMNHKVDRDVTAGYVTTPALFRELLAIQEQITRAVLSSSG